MRDITHIIIHCSDSPWGCAREINEWHIARGFAKIGYHFVILNGWTEPELRMMSAEGQIECGRRIGEAGAHCRGPMNESSIGICLIGNGPNTFVLEQFDALKSLLTDLYKTYRISPENVLGHNETESGKEQGKTCPNFDVGDIRKWMRGRIYH
jgi:N-acetyl-anhydromuramyl-L-alanine amidase AmpD